MLSAVCLQFCVKAGIGFPERIPRLTDTGKRQDLPRGERKSHKSGSRSIWLVLLISTMIESMQIVFMQ
jgi:hypothetical protein